MKSSRRGTAGGCLWIARLHTQIGMTISSLRLIHGGSISSLSIQFRRSINSLRFINDGIIIINKKVILYILIHGRPIRIQKFLYENFILQFMVCNGKNGRQPSRYEQRPIDLSLNASIRITLQRFTSWNTLLHNGQLFVTFDHSTMQEKQNIWLQHGMTPRIVTVWRQMANASFPLHFESLRHST